MEIMQQTLGLQQQKITWRIKKKNKSLKILFLEGINIQ